MYHDISERASVISVSPARFAWQMELLHRRGYQVLSLTQLVTCLQSDGGVPERSVVLTFDDGFESTYLVAFPALERYGFSATVFLVPDYCGGQNAWPSQPAIVPRGPLMSWRQIREMDEHGIEFGAHTCSHPRLDGLSAEDAEREILGSKQAVEERLERSVRHFAYPYGRLSAHAKETVASAFNSGCTTSLGLVRPTSDVFALERVDARYIDPRTATLGLSSPLFARYLDALRPGRRGWAMLTRRPRL